MIMIAHRCPRFVLRVDLHATMRAGARFVRVKEFAVPLP
jgi:hypothetical protein